jgi:hypothetical protein
MRLQERPASPAFSKISRTLRSLLALALSHAGIFARRRRLAMAVVPSSKEESKHPSLGTADFRVRAKRFLHADRLLVLAWGVERVRPMGPASG